MAGFELESLLNQNSLVFSSMVFLFRFLPVLMLACYLTPARYRYFTLFVTSILLYACGEPGYVLLLLAGIALNFLIGRRMYVDIESPFIHSRWRNHRRRKWLIFAVVINVGILAFFKIGNLLDANILLPLGISFYTFKMLSYQIDVYRGDVGAEQNFVRFAGYVSLFPQITSGPIMRYGQALEGLEGHRTDPQHIEEGIRLLVLGLGAKVLLADRMALLWNDMQTIGFDSISTPLAWLGAITYSLRLYFDFEGYSLMAAGVGMLFGLPFIRNFDQPYSAGSVSAFFRRWHMTLGNWFRDYVYIPLGGNRKGLLRTLLNLAFVWLLTGLWHGSGLNFLIWGLSVGVLIILEKLFLGKLLEKNKVISHIYVLFVMPLTWVIFAVAGLEELGIYFSRLFPFFGAVSDSVNPGDILKYISMYGILLLAGIFFCIPIVGRWYEKHCRRWYITVGLLVIFWLSIYQLSVSSNNPFLYFRF